jgi:hypothetical protein
MAKAQWEKDQEKQSRRGAVKVMPYLFTSTKDKR